MAQNAGAGRAVVGALDGYLSIGQLAARLGVTREWARQLVQAGAVQAVRTPIGWLAEPASAAELVERRAAVREAAGRVNPRGQRT